MSDCALITPVYLEIALFSGARSGAKGSSLVGQQMVARIKRLQKAVQLVLSGKMAQADAPGGKGIAAVLADGQHRPGGQPIGRAGGLDRYAYAAGIQLPLKTVPFTPCTLRFRICGTASAGLLMRTLG